MKTIVNVAYNAGNAVNEIGILEVVTGVVTYSDGSEEALTTSKRVQEVMKQYQEQLIEATQLPKTIKTKIYCHRNKESNWDQGQEIGLTEKALSTFAYTGYEVTIDIEVDRKTGEAKATHFNGVKLVTPVEV